jgi:hypothetical protein
MPTRAEVGKEPNLPREIILREGRREGKGEVASTETCDQLVCRIWGLVRDVLGRTKDWERAEKEKSNPYLSPFTSTILMSLLGSSSMTESPDLMTFVRLISCSSIDRGAWRRKGGRCRDEAERSAFAIECC